MPTDPRIADSPTDLVAELEQVGSSIGVYKDVAALLLRAAAELRRALTAMIDSPTPMPNTPRERLVCPNCKGLSRNYDPDWYCPRCDNTGLLDQAGREGSGEEAGEGKSSGETAFVGISQDKTYRDEGRPSEPEALPSPTVPHPSPAPCGMEQVEQAIDNFLQADRSLQRWGSTERQRLRNVARQALLDLWRAKEQQLAVLQNHVSDIEASCFRICDANTEQTCAGEPDPNEARFVCLNENGDPCIEADTAVGVIEGMSECWIATQERVEEAESQLAVVRTELAALKADGVENGRETVESRVQCNINAPWTGYLVTLPDGSIPIGQRVRITAIGEER